MLFLGRRAFYALSLLNFYNLLLFVLVNPNCLRSIKHLSRGHADGRLQWNSVSRPSLSLSNPSGVKCSREGVHKFQGGSTFRRLATLRSHRNSRKAGSSGNATPADVTVSGNAYPSPRNFRWLGMSRPFGTPISLCSASPLVPRVAGRTAARTGWGALGACLSLFASSLLLPLAMGIPAAQARSPYTPMLWTLADVRRAMPPHLFVRETSRGLLYVMRDFVMVVAMWCLATYIDPFCANLNPTLLRFVMRWALWAVYWWFQGLIFCGIWVLGHECGHGALSANKAVCDAIGYISHTVLWTPYFSWKATHHRHHVHTGSMEHDDAFRPKTLSEVRSAGRPLVDLEDLLGDTPIHALCSLLFRQVVGYPVHMMYDILGVKTVPLWLRNPDAPVVRQQMKGIVLSDIGILAMAYATWYAGQMWGVGAVVRYYGIPWILVSHWFVTVTYLHHTDPEVPRFRKGKWTAARGMAATVDRDFLGWMGKFFLHGIAHYHVVHHFFPKIPFYHVEEATQYLKAFIGPEHYHHSSKPVLKALWDNYNQCICVDDADDVLFYCDSRGRLVGQPSSE